MNLNKKELETSINKFWDDSIVPTLIEYIKIPNKSPSFDPDWKRNGHMDKVLVMAAEWAKKHMPEEAELTTKESPGRTPIILIDVPGETDGNILMYGHLDKQPEMDGWEEELGPWTPVIKENKLFGFGHITTNKLNKETKK